MEFKTINDFLTNLPKEELEIVQFIQKVIRDCMPDAKEKIASNIPFYYRHARICYIWPASISWEKVTAGVGVGFCKDEDFLDHTFASVALVYNSIADIDVAVLKQRIESAIILDNKIVKVRRRRIQ